MAKPKEEPQTPPAAGAPAASSASEASAAAVEPDEAELGDFILTQATTDEVALRAALAALPYHLARTPETAVSAAISTGELFAEAWQRRDDVLLEEPQQEAGA